MVSPTWNVLRRNHDAVRTLLMLLSVAVAGCSTAGKTGGQHQSSEQKAKIYVEAANASLSEGDPTGALQYLKQAEAEDPKIADIYHLKAIAFHTKKDFPRAILEMKKAIDLNPEDSNANNTYGKLLLDAGRNAEAEGPLRKAGDDPTYRDAFKSHTNLGILYYRTNRLNLADENFNRAIQDNENAACIAYYYRGHIALKRSQPLPALKDYERASQKLCAAFPDAHYALGVLYERNRDFEKARKKYLEVKQNFPESPLAEQAMERLKKLP